MKPRSKTSPIRKLTNIKKLEVSVSKGEGASGADNSLPGSPSIQPKTLTPKQKMESVENKICSQE